MKQKHSSFQETLKFPSQSCNYPKIYSASNLMQVKSKCYYEENHTRTQITKEAEAALQITCLHLFLNHELIFEYPQLHKKIHQQVSNDIIYTRKIIKANTIIPG